MTFERELEMIHDSIAIFGSIMRMHINDFSDEEKSVLSRIGFTLGHLEETLKPFTSTKEIKW